MANWQTKWKVPFVALNNKKYCVDILVDDVSPLGNVYVLEGAANPFETRENNSSDYFLPMRAQTGYIRINSTEKDLNGVAFDWHDIIPDNNLQHQVRLMYEHGNSRDIVWIGYMKAEMFTMQAFAGLTELSFPVVCPIGLLQLVPLVYSCDWNGTTVKSVAQMLHLALSATGVSWRNVYITKNLSSGSGLDMNDDINAKISLMNYINVDPLLSGTGDLPLRTATWTEEKPMSTIVESICRFWGWTVFSRGLDVYIIASSDEDSTRTYRKFSFADLALDTISSSTQTDTYNGYELSLSPDTNDTSLEYRTTDHYEETILGRNNVVITANVNEKQIVLAPDFSEMTFVPSSLSWNVLPDVYNDSQGPKYYSFLFRVTEATTQVHEVFVKQNTSAYSGYSRQITVLSMDDTWAVDAEKTSMSTRKNLAILRADLGSVQPSYNPQTETPPTPDAELITLTTIHSLIIPSDCMISITASARVDINPLTAQDAQFQYNTAVDFVWMKVSVFWKGPSTTSRLSWVMQYNTWQPGSGYDRTLGYWLDDNSSTIVRAPINNFSKLAMTKTVPDPYYGASGLCMKIGNDQQIIGRLAITIMNKPGRNSILDDFQVKIVPKDDMVFPKAKATHTYEGVANDTFKQDENVSLDLASGNKNKYGFGQVFTASGTYMTAVRFVSESGTTLLPEEHLLNRMCAAYAKKHNRLQIVVEENKYNGSSTSNQANAIGLPTTQFTRNWDNNETYIIQAVDHNWRDATMKLTLIERYNYER